MSPGSIGKPGRFSLCLRTAVRMCVGAESAPSYRKAWWSSDYFLRRRSLILRHTNGAARISNLFNMVPISPPNRVQDTRLSYHRRSTFEPVRTRSLLGLRRKPSSVLHGIRRKGPLILALRPARRRAAFCGERRRRCHSFQNCPQAGRRPTRRPGPMGSGSLPDLWDPLRSHL